MERKYNSWSDKEKTLLFNFVIDGIQRGEKIQDLLTSFAETYMISRGSALGQWNILARERRLYVEIAKHTWRNVVKPELEAKAKAERAEARRLERIRKKNQKMREQWRKEKARLEKKRVKEVRITTNRYANPKTQWVYVVDSNGLVVSVKRVINE